ncbi:hypothetical protein Shyd_86030 [Streptomyces hydrogenans]|uniref:Uncharacterized protein n=1 Tax=Streptomyces hydrogenans TaxID=1873719 RepID=A0ABQ3PQB7_9ACTN|nr:hypothetical protein GCM10018784_73730 [Streptomyces hydrogenans]GHI27232.1 hypothetical protein Shyd_86030 [Streptomyces hydrogenans]
MTFVATAALSMFVLEDVLDLSGYPRKIFNFGFLCSWGMSLVLGALYYYRDDMLVRSDDESDSAPWVRRIAAKLYYPRAYDFWIALSGPRCGEPIWFRSGRRIINCCACQGSSASHPLAPTEPPLPEDRERVNGSGGDWQRCGLASGSARHPRLGSVNRAV